MGDLILVIVFGLAAGWTAWSLKGSLDSLVDPDGFIVQADGSAALARQMSALVAASVAFDLTALVALVLCATHYAGMAWQ